MDDVNEIHLSHDTMSSNRDKKKNYKVTGPLQVHFFENPFVGAGKDGGNVAGGKPIVIIGVQP